MIDLLAAYAGISARLAPLRAELESVGALVRALPDSTTFGSQSETGNIYFLVISSKAEKPEVIDFVLQDVVYTLRVIIEFPSQYGEKGVIYLTQRCIDLLLGYKPPQIKKGMFLIDSKSFRDQLWAIEVNFGLTAVLRETPIDIYEPLLKTLIYDNEDGTEFTRVQSNIP